MVASDGVEPPTPAFSGLYSLSLNPFSINNLIHQGGPLIEWETNRATVEALNHAAVVYRPELLDYQGAGPSSKRWRGS
jgi:hypothetical protein